MFKMLPFLFFLLLFLPGVVSTPVAFPGEVPPDHFTYDKPDDLSTIAPDTITPPTLKPPPMLPAPTTPPQPPSCPPDDDGPEDDDPDDLPDDTPDDDAPPAKPTTSSTPYTITPEKILQIAPSSESCDSASSEFADECRTAPVVADWISASFERYDISAAVEQAAVLGWMAMESGEFRYSRNHFPEPGVPGQGSKFYFVSCWFVLAVMTF
jgi:hypothetical protein